MEDFDNGITWGLNPGLRPLHKLYLAKLTVYNSGHNIVSTIGEGLRIGGGRDAQIVEVGVTHVHVNSSETKRNGRPLSRRVLHFVISSWFYSTK
jgi:hypothetical protein